MTCTHPPTHPPTGHPRAQVVACKRGSPLILGLRASPARAAAAGAGAAAGLHGAGGLEQGAPKARAVESVECFLASDASAVVEHTKK